MNTLNDVKEISCQVTTGKLIIKHKDNTAGESFDLANGFIFRLDWKMAEWKLDYTTGALSGLFTEIETQQSGTKIKFSKLYSAGGNPSSDPLLKFIGIEDIRDGAFSNEWPISFKKSNVRIQIENGRLSVQKANL